MAKGFRSFKHVTEDLVRHFCGEAEMTKDHPGYRYKKFDSFDELDAYFKEEFGEDWREQEWAKLWLQGHWRSERTDSYRQERNSPTGRGKKFRGRKPGSERDQLQKNPPKHITKRIPKHTLIALLEKYMTEGYKSLRQLEYIMEEREGIILSDNTIQRLLKEKVEK